MYYNNLSDRITIENIIITCLIIITLYIIIDKFYKKYHKEHFTNGEEEILNKISSIINNDADVTFKNVNIIGDLQLDSGNIILKKGNLTVESGKTYAPTLYTRCVYPDKDTTHLTYYKDKTEPEAVAGNDYIDFHGTMLTYGENKVSK